MGRRSGVEEGYCIKASLPSAEEWSSFFSTWGTDLLAQEPAVRWGKFFDAFTVMAQAGTASAQYEIDPAQVESFFAQFDEAYSQFYRSGAAVSVWDVAKLGADEVRVCSVLAWLLDCHGSHGQGDVFLRCFLGCLRKENRLLLPTEQNIVRGYRTNVESFYDIHVCAQQSESNSRVDIEINGPDILLFIEAKVHASETNNQLERYIDILRSTAGARGRALVFVTPTGRPPGCEFVSTQDEVIALSWKKISQQFSLCVNTLECKHSLAYVLIRQYCDHINRF